MTAASGQEFVPFMQEAIRLAAQGRWKTCPNPAVGALLVRDGRIVARGRHRAAGQDHAEVACLKDAARQGISPRGCDLVVTLEPCNHYGKTPPCTQAVIDAGIRRVVIGLEDPNPVAAGGATRLREAGIEVLGPVCAGACRDLIADFLIWQKTGRPYVILKMASTLDGRIATRNGHSQWISGEASRQSVHALRADLALCGGAVLVGGRTFREDNPLLTARTEPPATAQPLACVLTSHLPAATEPFRLLRERPGETVFLVPPSAAGSGRAAALRDGGVRVLPVVQGADGGADLAGMLHCLRQELACPYVLCEGGGRLALSLLQAGLVDEFHLHLSPLIFGDNDARPLFSGRAPLHLGEGIALRVCRVAQCGEDAHILLRPNARNPASQRD